MTVSALPVLTGDSGFFNYLREVRAIPSLEAEEEYMLAKRYKEHEDTSAAHKLVTSHLKLVAKIAGSFKGYGLPIVELVSEGNLGLMQAVKKFEPDKGFRLSTYAMCWIKASIQEYVVKSWSLVKIGTTAAQKKLFFNLGKIKRRIQSFEKRDFNVGDYKQVASELDVNISDVAEMNIRMVQDYSINDPLSGEEDGASMIDILPETSDSQEYLLAENQEIDYKKSLFSIAMKDLNAREQDIIKMRRLHEPAITLDVLSKKYNISRERVRQVEARAFEKLQAKVQELSNPNL